MKTISRRWALLGLAGLALGFAGCSASNDANAMSTPTGKIEPGVTPQNAIRDSKKFSEANKGPITDPAKYKNDTK